jgi:cell division protein ZapA (FtsZ GTPase activity inhibitor)
MLSQRIKDDSIRIAVYQDRIVSVQRCSFSFSGLSNLMSIVKLNMMKELKEKKRKEDFIEKWPQAIYLLETCLQRLKLC